jgi:hypothetical protein
MFSRRKARLVVFAAVAATLGGGLFVYVTPASTNVNPAPVYDRPGIADGATITPWGEYLSAGAVDSAGIENDLDGNTSALFASDQLVRAAGMR